MESQQPILEDDSKEKISLLLERRIPWLFLGLLGGIATTIFTARFEKVLDANIQLAFFIPFIVYMADAIGTQTETIFTRSLVKKNAHIKIYLIKEFILGNITGLIFAFLIGAFAYMWFGSVETAVTVGLAMYINIAIAPVVAVLVPTFLQKEHTDPAIGGGPFTTVIQDFLSLIIYFSIASFIIFR